MVTAEQKRGTAEQKRGMSEQKRGMSEIETAEYLSLSRSTLRQGRMNGTRENRIITPPFVKVGRKVIYLIDDLDMWLENNRQAA